MTLTLVQDDNNTNDNEWGDFLDRGKALLNKKDSVQWELGDLLLDLVKFKEKQGKRNSLLIIRAYALKLDVKFRTLESYRYVAYKWPPQERIPQVAWSAHRICSDTKHILTERVRQRKSVTSSDLRKAVNNYSYKTGKWKRGSQSPRNINWEKAYKALEKAAQEVYKQGPFLVHSPEYDDIERIIKILKECGE